MSNNKLEIPGLLSKGDSKLTEAEIQAQRDIFAKQQALMNKPMRPIPVNRKVDNNSIPDSMTTIHELTLEQVKAMYPDQQVSLVNQKSNQSYVDFNGTGQPYWGIDLGQDWMKQQPYQQPLDDYKKYFEPKKYGPSPSRQSGNDFFDQQALLDMVKAKRKSSFEEIIDQLFSTAEKEQFLIDAGYMLERSSEDQARPIISRKLADGTVKTITNSLDELFLKEITIKFKNLLVSKATLKMKF